MRAHLRLKMIRDIIASRVDDVVCLSHTPIVGRWSEDGKISNSIFSGWDVWCLPTHQTRTHILRRRQKVLYKNIQRDKKHLLSEFQIDLTFIKLVSYTLLYIIIQNTIS